MSMCSGNIYVDHLRDVAFELLAILGGKQRTLIAAEREVAISAVPKNAASARQVMLGESITLGHTTVVRATRKPEGDAFTILLVNTERSRMPRDKGAAHQRYRQPEAAHVWEAARP